MKKLILVGCVHVGSKAANLDWFKQYAEQAKDKNTNLLLLGDLFENAVPSSGKGMMWEQDLIPDEQLDVVAGILEPVKHKIIGCCTSNHSERSYKDSGINLDKRLLRELRLSDSLYKGQQGVVCYSNKRIAFAHGTGSGSNTWADANRLLQFYPEADVVAVSHKHESTYTWKGNYKLHSDGSKHIKYIPLVRTGSLMTHARYAQRELYTPQKPGFSVITFHDDGRMEVDANGI